MKEFRELKTFKRLATALLMEKDLNIWAKLSEEYHNIIKEVKNDLEEDYRILKNYFKNNVETVNTPLKLDILKIAEEQELWDLEILPLYQKFSKNLEKYSFVQYLQVNRWEEKSIKEINNIINKLLLFEAKHSNLTNYTLTKIETNEMV
jgi:hypothetical protein